MSWFRSFFAWFALWRSRHGVLLERNGGLGDLLCLLPSLAALKAQSPKRKVLLITSRAFVPLMKQAGVLDAVVSSDTRGLQWWRRHLGVKSVWLPDELLPPKSRAAIHLIEEFARSLSLKDVVIRHRLIKAPTALIQCSKQQLTSQPLIVIHSGPTWPVKMWPQGKWQQLVEALQQEFGVLVMQVGADTHDSQSNVVAARIQGAQDWIGRLSLLEILALLGEAKLFVGVDSGLLHLAASAGTSTVGLFGPTLSHCILPPGENYLGVSASVPCTGCHYGDPTPIHWRTGCPHEIRCMENLSVEAVLSQCRSLLNAPKECH